MRSAASLCHYAAGAWQRCASQAWQAVSEILSGHADLLEAKARPLRTVPKDTPCRAVGGSASIFCFASVCVGACALGGAAGTRGGVIVTTPTPLNDHTIRRSDQLAHQADRHGIEYSMGPWMDGWVDRSGGEDVPSGTSHCCLLQHLRSSSCQRILPSAHTTHSTQRRAAIPSAPPHSIPVSTSISQHPCYFSCRLLFACLHRVALPPRSTPPPADSRRPRCVGYHAVQDTVSCGIPRRAGYNTPP